ncbi:DinB family protein [Mesobacillus subterraneus]|uniref:DinB family protein n=1 Tax=Mesobacillus subterraneus TaxID=285983 RepID=UPI0014733BFD|nr:DinB family protein [Mesobacillus subterraneus]
MLDLFFYNWQVREEWLKWCKSIPTEELQAERVGGMGSILKNLIHVIDCELLWINYMLEEPYHYSEKDFIVNLEDVERYSLFTKNVTEHFLLNLPKDYEKKHIQISSKRGDTHFFTYGKIIRHIITHEIHHMGQLSIWSREVEVKPVSSDLIVRQYIKKDPF